MIDLENLISDDDSHSPLNVAGPSTEILSLLTERESFQHTQTLLREVANQNRGDFISGESRNLELSDALNLLRHPSDFSVLLEEHLGQSRAHSEKQRTIRIDAAEASRDADNLQEMLSSVVSTSTKSGHISLLDLKNCTLKYVDMRDYFERYRRADDALDNFSFKEELSKVELKFKDVPPQIIKQAIEELHMEYMEDRGGHTYGSKVVFRWAKRYDAELFEKLSDDADLEGEMEKRYGALLIKMEAKLKKKIPQENIEKRSLDLFERLHDATSDSITFSAVTNFEMKSAERSSIHEPVPTSVKADIRKQAEVSCGIDSKGRLQLDLNEEVHLAFVIPCDAITLIRGNTASNTADALMSGSVKDTDERAVNEYDPVFDLQYLSSSGHKINYSIPKNIGERPIRELNEPVVMALHCPATGKPYLKALGILVSIEMASTSPKEI